MTKLFDWGVQKKRCGMIKNMFREIRDGEDVTDIIAKFFAFIAIPAALFEIGVALWAIIHTPGNPCGPGACWVHSNTTKTGTAIRSAFNNRGLLTTHFHCRIEFQIIPGNKMEPSFLYPAGLLPGRCPLTKGVWRLLPIINIDSFCGLFYFYVCLNQSPLALLTCFYNNYSLI